MGHSTRLSGKESGTSLLQANVDHAQGEFGGQVSSSDSRFPQTDSVFQFFVQYLVTEPVLAQCCLVMFFFKLIQGGFWGSLAFILAGLYGYNP